MCCAPEDVIEIEYYPNFEATTKNPLDLISLAQTAQSANENLMNNLGNPSEQSARQGKSINESEEEKTLDQDSEPANNERSILPQDDNENVS
jgi:hypothetical protein